MNATQQSAGTLARPSIRRPRIAVIDSGVNAGHPHICAPTRGMISGGEPGDTWADQLGHGTAVMAAIQEKAPGADYMAVKLFHRSLRSSTARLFEALALAIEQDFDIVNLSLGTTNFDSREGFEAFVERARRAGTILVSAMYMGDQPALPGCLPGVIGVDVDWDLPRDRYRVEQRDRGVCYVASGYPRPLPGMTPARNLNGISFAVANMTGLVARAWTKIESPDCGSVREALLDGPDFAQRCVPANEPGCSISEKTTRE